MKSREAFLQSFGGADEAFAGLVRRTLAELQQKEEKIVKKKMSFGLVLAAAILLIGATALAVGAWGIGEYLAESGRELRPYQLISDVPQRMAENDVLDVLIEEALCDGEMFYMTVRFTPKQPGMMIVLDGYETQTDGFERIMTVSQMTGFPMDGEASYIRCENLPDGVLRVLVEGRAAAGTQTYPGMLIPMWWNFIVSEGGNAWQMEVTADVPMRENGLSRRSMAEDAHVLANTKGAVRWISVERTEQGYAYFTMVVEGMPSETEAGRLMMPYAQLIGDDGAVLCELNCSRSFLVSTDGQQFLCSLPAEYAGLDRMTIRLLDFATGEVYDEYTYTME